MRLLRLPAASLLYRVPATVAFALVALPASTVLCQAPLATLATRRRFGRVAVKLAMAVVGQPLRVRGLENLPPGACVVVANHASYLDGLLLTAALPERFTFVVHDGAASTPLVGTTIKRMGVAFVSREKAREAGKALIDLGCRLGQGESLAVFPEGGFVAGPGLRIFHPGAFRMAAMAGVPVVPAVILGSRRLLGSGAKLLSWSPVQVEILPPLPIPPPGKAGLQATAAAARQAILAVLDEPDAGCSPASPAPAVHPLPPVQPS